MLKCSRCKLDKEKKYFSIRKDRSRGFCYYCKDCEAEKQRNNQNHKIAVKKWSEKNPENLKKRKLAYYERNIKNHIVPDNKTCRRCKILKNNTFFGKCKTNKDGLARYCLTCTNELQRISYKKHSKIRMLETRTKQLTRKQRTPKWANLDKIREIYKNRPEGHHVDHIIPLNGKNVCGLHVETNLQYLKATENLSKGNKHG